MLRIATKIAHPTPPRLSKRWAANIPFAESLRNGSGTASDSRESVHFAGWCRQLGEGIGVSEVALLEAMPQPLRARDFVIGSEERRRLDIGGFVANLILEHGTLSYAYRMPRTKSIVETSR